MSTTFPTSLQDLDSTRGTANQPLNSPSHVTHHALEDDTIEALQSKVGIDSSAVATSLDYILKNTTSGHDHDGTDSKKVIGTNLDVTGLTALGLLRTNTGGTAIESAGIAVTDVVTATSTTTLTNKTLTAPIIATISNTGTLTLPTSTDTLVGKATTDTLTNKRITKRIGTEVSSATSTPTADSVDQWNITALAAADAIAAPTGTPTDGQTLIFRILDNGTARALTWNAIYVARGVTLPSTTVISKYLYVGFIYNATSSKWECVASSQET